MGAGPPGAMEKEKDWKFAQASRMEIGRHKEKAERDAWFQERADKYDESYGAPIEGNTRLEITWTLIPTVVVFAIAIYSMQVNDKLDALGPRIQEHFEFTSSIQS